jgi:Flp pilus assembly protein TadD
LEPAAWAPVQPQAATATTATPRPAANSDDVTPHATYNTLNLLKGREPWPTTPQLIQTASVVNANANTPAPRKHKIVVLALAAISGCALLSFWALQANSTTSDPANAALGALQQGPSGPAATQQPNPADNAGSAANKPPTWPRAQDDKAVATSTPAASTRASDPTRISEPAAEKSPTQTLVDEGMALATQGRLGLAESAYQKALRATPEYPDAIAGLVRVHLARRDAVEAVRWANRLIAKQPANGVNQLLLGDALALRGDEDAARVAWKEAVKRGNALAKQRLE